MPLLLLLSLPLYQGVGVLTEDRYGDWFRDVAVSVSPCRLSLSCSISGRDVCPGRLVLFRALLRLDLAIGGKRTIVSLLASAGTVLGGACFGFRAGIKQCRFSSPLEDRFSTSLLKDWFSDIRASYLSYIWAKLTCICVLRDWTLLKVASALLHWAFHIWMSRSALSLRACSRLSSNSRPSSFTWYSLFCSDMYLRYLKPGRKYSFTIKPWDLYLAWYLYIWRTFYHLSYC